MLHDIIILIGDDTPAKTLYAKILIEKEGATYQMDGGSPILPVFALDKVQTARPVDPPQHTSQRSILEGQDSFEHRSSTPCLQ